MDKYKCMMMKYVLRILGRNEDFRPYTNNFKMPSRLRSVKSSETYFGISFTSLGHTFLNYSKRIIPIKWIWKKSYMDKG
jgi:hypothetical protein